MAITIRNKQTESMIRKLGIRWSTGPSGVVRRLAERELMRTTAISQAEHKRRVKVWDELDREFPPPTDREQREMQHELDHMYDYLDAEADEEMPGGKTVAS